MVGRTCRGKGDGRSGERLGSVTWAGQQLGGGGGTEQSLHAAEHQSHHLHRHHRADWCGAQIRSPEWHVASRTHVGRGRQRGAAAVGTGR